MGHSHAGHCMLVLLCVIIFIVNTDHNNTSPF